MEHASGNVIKFLNIQWTAEKAKTFYVILQKVKRYVSGYFPIYLYYHIKKTQAKATFSHRVIWKSNIWLSFRPNSFSYYASFVCVYTHIHINIYTHMYIYVYGTFPFPIDKIFIMHMIDRRGSFHKFLFIYRFYHSPHICQLDLWKYI